MSKRACVIESVFESHGIEVVDSVGITIHDLPYEILDYIFSYLSVKERLRTELVCKRWSTFGTTVRWSWPIAFDGSDLHPPEPDEDIGRVIFPSFLSRCGVSLKKLNISCIATVKKKEKLLTRENQRWWPLADSFTFMLDSRPLRLIGNSCPNLTAIGLNLFDVKEYQEFPRDLENIAKCCPKLKQVHISDSRQLDDANLSAFLKHCHSLECLELHFNDGLDGEFMTAGNKNLKGFYVEQCCDSNVLIENIMNMCDKIEGFGVIEEGFVLAAPVLMKVLNYYKNTLKTLYLDHYCLKSSDWLRTAEMMQQLTVVSLKYALGVGDELMRHLAKRCHRLHSLNISGCDVSDVGVAALAAAPSLKVLDLSDLHRVGKGLMSLAMAGRLERLYCRYDEYNMHYMEIEDEYLIALAKHCPNFHMLDAVGCLSITDRVVDQFRFSLERGFLKGPVTLYVGGTKITKNVKSCDGLIVETVLMPIFKDFDHMSKA